MLKLKPSQIRAAQELMSRVQSLTRSLSALHLVTTVEVFPGVGVVVSQDVLRDAINAELNGSTAALAALGIEYEADNYPIDAISIGQLDSTVPLTRAA